MGADWGATATRTPVSANGVHKCPDGGVGQAFGSLLDACGRAAAGIRATGAGEGAREAPRLIKSVA
jgi:hypothetical protein